MKTVLVYGTFDILHRGHLDLLMQAKKKGDRLVVAIARDVIVKKFKGQNPVHSEKERKEVLLALRVVDQVVLADKEIGGHKSLLKVDPDVVVVGFDQEKLQKHLTQFVKEKGLKISVVRARAYGNKKKLSSRVIRKSL